MQHYMIVFQMGEQAVPAAAPIGASAPTPAPAPAPTHVSAQGRCQAVAAAPQPPPAHQDQVLLLPPTVNSQGKEGEFTEEFDASMVELVRQFRLKRID